MPTLSELARTQQTTTVGQAQNVSAQNVGGTSIQADKQIDDSAGLAKDIGKMFGGIMQEHQQASEYAGRRVGTDNLVEYKKEMSRISAYYIDKPHLTSADITAKSREEQGVYEHYMQKGHFGDNELANQSFRDTYADPAGEHLLGQKVLNDKQWFSLHTDEEVAGIKSEMTESAGVYNIENIKTWQDRLRAVRKDPNLIWDEAATGLNQAFNNDFIDGVHSTRLKAYLQDGALTQAGLDMLYNDYMGRFSTRTNGRYTKTYSDMTDASHDAIIKSFGGWIDSLNKPDKTKIDATALKIVNDLQMSNSSSDFNTAYSELTSQYIAATGQALNGNKDAMTKLPLYRDELVELEMKMAKKSYLSNVYSRFIKSENGDIPELYSDNNFNATSKSYSGFKPVHRNISVTSNDVQTYIHNELSKEIDATLNSKEINVDAMNDLSRKISGLQSSFSGNANKKANGIMKGVSNVSFLYKANSAEELINNLQFATSYKVDTGADQYTSLTQANLNAVSGYYEELKKRQENDESLTDQSILSKTRILATAYMDAGSKMAFEKTRDIYRRVGIEYDSDKGDVFVNGAVFTWNIGTAKFVDGALPVAMDIVANSGKAIQSSDDAVSMIKGRMMYIDNSKFPIFGTNLALVKPSTSVSDNNLRQNIIDLTKEKLYKNVKIQNIDFADIVDEPTIQYRQVNDRRNGLQTIAELFHNGSIVSRAIVDDDEWIDGVTSERKAEVNKWYKSNGLDKLFEKRDATRDVSGIEGMF